MIQINKSVTALPDHYFKAQFKEDRALAKFFDFKEHGFYVEVGSYDGVRMSNSFAFEQIGWDGILIEAVPELAERCRLTRPRATTVNCAVVAPDSPSVVSFDVSEEWKSLSSLALDLEQMNRIRRFTGRVKVNKISVLGKMLDTILEEHNVAEIDFLTIDVEGYEWGVLQGFSISRWRPIVVIVERNTLLPDSRIMKYFQDAGYLYRCRTGVNDWFFLSTTASTGRMQYRIWLNTTLYVSQPLAYNYRILRKRFPRFMKSVLRRLGLYSILKYLGELVGVGRR